MSSPNSGNTVVFILNVCMAKHPNCSIVSQQRLSEVMLSPFFFVLMFLLLYHLDEEMKAFRGWR